MILPDILLITVDCLRASDLSTLLSALTPSRRDEFLYNLPNHFAHAPFTAGSFKSLFGDELPLDGKSGLAISSDRITLAERLRQVGYQTIGIHSNPLLANKSFARGFDHYLDATHLVKTMPFGRALELSGYLNMGLEVVERWLNKYNLRTRTHIGAPVIERIAGKLAGESSHQKPLFLWVHFMDAHWPYGLSPWHFGRTADQRRQFLANECGESVTKIDVSYWYRRYLESLRRIGRAVDHLPLKLRNLRPDRPLHVILTSDHGEGFTDNGHLFLSHQALLYDELVHVPVVSNVPLASQNRAITCHRDLYWDILNLAGIGAGASRTWSDWINMEVVDDIHHDQGYPIVGCRTKTKKVLVNKESTVMYDLMADPEEQYPIVVSAEVPGDGRLVAEAKNRYQDIVNHRVGSHSDHTDDHYFDAAERVIEDRLRMLGYI